MDGDRIGARLDENLDVLLRLADHQVRVERQLGDLAHRFENRHAHRKIRHEVAVHHIEVEQVGARTLDRANLVAETREIGGQQ